MKADINITPLIDVLLVLLIIFMLIAPVPPQALDASLPRSPEDRGGPTPPTLVLEVRADDYALNTTPVLTRTDLEQRLRTTLDGRRDRTLFVKPVGDVSYERVLSAIDAAEGAGADRIGLVQAAPGKHP